MDTNDDGEIDMLDWEIGALKLANSEGNDWPAQIDGGYCYLPYRLLPLERPDPQDPNNIIPVLWDKKVHVIHVTEQNPPQMTVKVKMEYNPRYKVKLNVGYANNANQTEPVEGFTSYSSFNFQGGNKHMQGISEDPIEIGLDYGHWYLNDDVGKIFFIVEENDPNSQSTGIIEYFSFIDYRWDEEFEIYCDETNVAIVNNDETMLSIDYDLIPHENNITNNLTFDSDMVSRFNPKVANSSTLTVDDGVKIDMYESNLTIENNSSLVIGDDVIITAKKGNCNIFVYGDISIGDNVKFIGEDGAQIKIYLYNTSEILTIDNCDFEEAAIDSDISSLTITNSDFTSGSGIFGNYGNYTISDCDFNESFAHFPYTNSNSKKVSLNTCTFINSTIDAIRVFHYDNFEIKNCTINSSDRNGIYLSNAGGGRDNEISDCYMVLNNSTSYSAIVLYSSTVDIRDNYIAGNYYGIKCFNTSNTNIEGSNSHAITQRIINNTSYELFASYGSFPYNVKYNAIHDDDNPQPIIYYTTGAFAHTLDVRNNNWDANFNYLTDLSPASWYLWQPTWNPPGSKSGEVGEELYFLATQKIEAEDYAGAKADLMQIVKQDAQSPYAEAALRDIFEIEEHGENDFAGLQTYYIEDPYVQSTEFLIRRGEFFANLCDVKLKNWQDAIDWYENIIQYPSSMEDSIFAIIDLGQLYLLMEEGGTKSAYSCKMPEHQPKSVTAYNEKKDYLLSLIPGEKLSDALLTDLEEMKAGELLQNIPNPFNTSTQIWYKLNTDAVVSIAVFNTTGKNIQTYNQGNMDAGVNSVEFKPDHLTPGIYFYSININGKTTESKKMTIIK